MPHDCLAAGVWKSICIVRQIVHLRRAVSSLSCSSCSSILEVTKACKRSERSSQVNSCSNLLSQLALAI